MASTTPADDEIRRILNDEDIERLRKRFLCALKYMDNNNTNNSYDFDQVYDRMGLGGYDLPLAMGRVIEHYLLSQGLIQIDGERVRITETGRHRCKQFRHTDDQEWRETMRRMDRYARITDTKKQTP